MIQPVAEHEPFGRPALLRVEVEERLAIQLRRILELEREPVAEHLLVGALLVADVVRLEAGREALIDRLESRDAAAELAQRHTLRIAAQLGARRIVGDVVVGTLEGVHVVGLQRRDRLLRAAHVARRDEAAQLVVVADEAATEIEAAGVGAAREVGRAAGVERAVDAGEHEADVAAAVGLIALHAKHAVVRARLDGGSDAVEHRDAVDALGDGVEHADREAVGEAAGELRRRGDRRRRGAGRVAVARR